MKNLYLLLPGDVWAKPEEHKSLSTTIVAGYQALFHPALLAEAEALPAIATLGEIPKAQDLVLVVPRQCYESAGELVRKDLEESGAKVLLAGPEHATLTGPIRLVEPLQLPAGDPEMLLDFYAAGYAHLGLQVLFEQMGHENPIDPWTVRYELQQSAEQYLDDNKELARTNLQSALDHMLNGRQVVYPATIHWIDLGFLPPGISPKELESRTGWAAPLNLILSGCELDRLAEQQPEILAAIKLAIDSGGIEILGGTYDERPWKLLPFESRCWQLERAAVAYLQHLGRDVDCFGARTMALVPDLPQLLMKFQYRYALHAAFAAGKYPHFVDPKLHWTAVDGSVIEAVARTARSAAVEHDALGIFAALAKSAMHDRAATIVLAHWVAPAALWYQWLLRLSQFAPVFGRFSTFSDYFFSSTVSDRPTHTRTEEYQSGVFPSATVPRRPDPISSWVGFHHRRGRTEALGALAGLLQIAAGIDAPDLDNLEDALEDGTPVDEELNRHEHEIARKLADFTLRQAQPAEGYLLFNPCSFPRRACLFLDELSAEPAGSGLEPPLKALQPAGDRTAVVIDLPGWGYCWLPRHSEGQRSKESLPPLASGKRLRNELVEVEIDTKTGGIRGFWPVRTGYSRMGQQLVHGAGSNMVCQRRQITASGPAFGECVTEGDLLGPDKRKLATFRQTARLWLGRPQLDLEIHIEPLREVTGDPGADYFACRWAWPDEKTLVLPGSGYLLQPSAAAELEAAQLVELRERKLCSQILPRGLPFHRRTGYRMADTLLMVEGETRRDFAQSVALDLAYPWRGAQESFWPVVACKVDHGPPKAGRVGWLARLGAPNVLCSRLLPLEAGRPGVMFRLVETAGTATAAELRFCRDPASAKLINARGQLIFDLHPNGDRLQVDLAPHELLQLEVLF